MPLRQGSRLGPYEVLSALGAGGMGEVWRARDTRLGRDVALKVLPAAFASDPERLARFGREAKVLASLNHPHVGGIHGLEEADGVKALVLGLVEGPTLADRIERGPIAVDEALTIAEQIAEALEAAHEQGIIHRDLKPANIKVKPDGTVKVLDFGLAKALEPQLAAAQADFSHSPTLTLGAAATQMGVILGTAAYMAPEQARGRPFDKRADIWAFGCVLYEMLTGRRAFAGEDVTDTLASIVRAEPDWDALPAAVPRRVRELLRRCLQKDPRTRLRDIGDARLEITATSSDSEADPPATRGGESKRFSLRTVLVAGVVALTLGALVAAIALTRRASDAGTPMVSRFSIALPAEAPFVVLSWPNACLAISRDGSRIVYCGGNRPLYLRRLGDLEVRAIPGTDGAYAPFFSPDGDWVAFFNLKNELEKVSLSGGTSVTIASDVLNSYFVTGTWTDDDRIVFDSWNGGLHVVPADGGAASTLTAPVQEWHQDPQALPGSSSILYFAKKGTTDRIESLSLDGGEPKTVLENASHPRYLASGHLLFTRDGNLMVAPFDAERLEVTGPAASVPLDVMVDEVAQSSPLPQLAVSQGGTLVYAPNDPTRVGPSTFTWVDRGGRVEDITTLPGLRPLFALSPDGTRVAISSRARSKIELQLYHLESRTLTTLEAHPQDYPSGPVWSPDGRRVFFSRFATHLGAMMVHDLDGSSEPQELVSMPGTYFSANALTKDGRFLAFSFNNTETKNQDIWVLDLDAPAGKEAARPFLDTPATEQSAAFSPDGRWIAYISDESGPYNVYLRRFPGGESKRRVSSLNGFSPLWSADGRELFFQAGSASGAQMFAAEVHEEPELSFGEPRLLFEGRFLCCSDVGRTYAVAPDGRFLMTRGERVVARELVVVQNWFAEIERLAPGTS